MEEFSVAFGNRLRALRQRTGLSQEEVAYKAGITAAHLGLIERAVKRPTLDTVAKLSAALDVPASALFTSVDAIPTEETPTMRKIMAQLSVMSEAEQKDILKIIRICKEFGTEE